MTVAKVTTPDNTPIGRFVFERMVAQGLNIAELSRLAGVGASTISNLKNGNYPPGIKLLQKLAPHLGVTLGELLVAYGISLLATEEVENHG